jgi:hypothetical protein
MSTDPGSPAAPPPPPPPIAYHPYPAPAPLPPRPTHTNGFAIASLVLGILWLSWIGSIMALVFGHVSKAQIEASGGTQGGGGLATAGFVLGWIGIGFLALYLTLGIALGIVAGTD